MAIPPKKPNSSTNLRTIAQSRLGRSVNLRETNASASEALGVLYELALSPKTAPGALALLHELQVHQVELDLQAEELRTATATLEAELARQMQRYDKSPAGHLILDSHGRVADVNLTGAQQLGAERELVRGQRLDHFLTPQSAIALQALLARAGQGHASSELTLVARPDSDAKARTVCASARIDPAGLGILLAFLDMPTR
ncbi:MULTISPECIES: PAS domain-containing protein [unclassified Simplicispira]|uniref:PAS domain-containing protein n=1 Tax=unclassified Simplicispira TaxID=2630407 RepID=UPI000D5F6A11|nr:MULTISPECIES: PAS domain-containing protein [unclassified Simplicispira]PVY56243.1 PAS domain-containing protein [Simplicispira sp. 125]REG17188.1 PAS domain-containing protein [Simplicispira sp. 110]